MPLHSCLELSSTQGSANCSARRGRSDEAGLRSGLLDGLCFIIFLRNMELSISYRKSC